MKRTLLWLAIIFALSSIMVASCLIWGSMVMAYPENMRLGYTSCAACHVSPTGGGVLKAYGRSAGEEMATWAPEGSGRLLGLVGMPEPVAIRGGARHVNINSDGYHRKFLMSADIELGVHASKEVWLVASGGVFGPERRREYRSNYVLWQPMKLVSWRLGKFFPAYGIMGADHTIPTRRGLGFDEGQESYNVEYGIHSKWAEFFFTAIYGNEVTLAMKADDGYKSEAIAPGAAARITLFLDTIHVGGSYRYSIRDLESLTDHIYGPFMLWAPRRELYWLGEADRVVTYPKNQEPPYYRDVAHSEVGYEVIHGLHAKTIGEYDAVRSYGGALQWFPVPHAELLLKAMKLRNLWTYTLMTHFYL